VPIYQSTSFVFEDAADAADLFALQKYGNIYTRISNPTTAAFEERMASLEGGIGAVAAASGQAAEFLTATALAGSGDNLVSASSLYGGTHTMFSTTLGRLGVEARFVDGDDPEAFASRVDARTRFLYTEIIGNPSGSVADLEALGEVAPPINCPWSSTQPSPPRTCAGPSSMGPTSSSTQPPSSSAATARLSVAWSSSQAASIGVLDGSTR